MGAATTTPCLALRRSGPFLALLLCFQILHTTQAFKLRAGYGEEKVPLAVIVPDPTPELSGSGQSPPPLPASPPVFGGGGDDMRPKLPTERWRRGSRGEVRRAAHPPAAAAASHSHEAPSPATAAFSPSAGPGAGPARAPVPGAEAPAPDSAGSGGSASITSSPAVPVPRGVTDTATILPMPAPGEKRQIEALKHVGVTEIVLAINYRPEGMYNFLKDSEDDLGVKITYSQETEHLGTAGPLALARDKLVDGSGEPFFVLNCNISEYPFAELVRFHKTHGEPSKYGVVITEEATGRVERFVEKPETFVGGDKINAGIYLLDPSVLDRIQLKPTSFEKEVFPGIVADKKLYAMVLLGFWMDIGQPRDYITVLLLYLGSVRESSPGRLATGEHVIGNVLVHRDGQDRGRVPDRPRRGHQGRVHGGGRCEAVE
ncbi:putative mannose-1-phosphate guanylyltransferase 3, partial [Dichanthelium oligosanthes]